MDKLAYMKSTKQVVRDTTRLSRNYRQATYVDKFLNNPAFKAPFRHDWAVLAHMHDLRVWTLAYAPSRLNNLQRMQEIHRLNNEMWYMVSRSLWKRIIVMAVLWILITRFGKKRYLNSGNFDTHDAQYRDTVAHM